ncbi:MAG: hypothetical protein RKE49_05490 [Oceanicaulis sp.]
MRIETLVKGLAIFAAMGLASACSTITPPTAVSDTASVLAGHRVIYTDAGARGVHVFDQNAMSPGLRVCLEPSPDAGSSESSALALGGIDTTTGRLSSDGDFGGVQVAGQMLSTDGSRNNDVQFQRNLAIEVFRETLSQACMAEAQGLITQDEYASFLRAASAGALTLATVEHIGMGPARVGSGVHAENIAEKMSALTQMALFALLLTDESSQGQAIDIINRVAEIKTEGLSQ